MDIYEVLWRTPKKYFARLPLKESPSNRLAMSGNSCQDSSACQFFFLFCSPGPAVKVSLPNPLHYIIYCGQDQPPGRHICFPSLFHRPSLLLSPPLMIINAIATIRKLNSSLKAFLTTLLYQHGWLAFYSGSNVPTLMYGGAAKNKSSIPTGIY